MEKFSLVHKSDSIEVISIVFTNYTIAPQGLPGNFREILEFGPENFRKSSKDQLGDFLGNKFLRPGFYEVELNAKIN